MKSVASQIWPKVREGHAVQLFKSYRKDVTDGGQQRDFVYVRDAADVTRWLFDNPQVSGIYNLGSGVGRTIESMLQLLVAQSGREVTVKVDPKRLRPIEIPALIGDVQKLKALGWAPSRTVESALGEILEEMESRAR